MRKETVESGEPILSRKTQMRTATIEADDGDGAILAAQIGLGAFLDGAGDFLHLGIARRRTQHLARGEQAIDHRQQAAAYGDQNRCH